MSNLQDRVFLWVLVGLFAVVAASVACGLAFLTWQMIAAPLGVC